MGIGTHEPSARMKYVITGGAGFIGSNLAAEFVRAGHEVHVVDNLSTGQARFLTDIDCHLHRIDLCSPTTDLGDIVAGAAAVYHLAANADVRFGWQDRRRDLSQNVIATLNVADACTAAGVRELIFSSTGSVYGQAAVIPTPEDAPYPIQTSLYGAAKSAAEGFLAAYAEAGLLTVTVFRFVSVLGPRYTHGHVIDFIRQLRRDPMRLLVLGDGTQRKSYMHVDDCVAAVSTVRTGEPFSVVNLGTAEYCTVLDSIGWIVDELGLAPVLEFTGGDRGWVGDNPFIWLDTARVRSTGWRPRYTIEASVRHTVSWLMANPWVLDIVDSRSNAQADPGGGR